MSARKYLKFPLVFIALILFNCQREDDAVLPQNEVKSLCDYKNQPRYFKNKTVPSLTTEGYNEPPLKLFNQNFLIVGMIFVKFNQLKTSAS